MKQRNNAPHAVRRGRSWLARSKRQLRFRISVVYHLAKSGRIPLKTKILAALAIGYLVSPIDLIPDFIPVLGQLDDALIVPLLVALTLRSVPRALVREAARKAVREPISLSKNWRAAVAIVVIWLAALALVVYFVLKIF